MGKWVLFAFTAPWSVFAWTLGCLSVGLGLAHKPRFEGAAILTLEWRKWVTRWWHYSTTVGRVVWFQPDARDAAVELDERLERHERTHVRQVEDLMLLSFAIGLVVALSGNPWLGLGLWFSGGAWQLPNFVTAMLRFGWGRGYRDSEHERSAYAQCDLWPNGESWWTTYSGDKREQERQREANAASIKPPLRREPTIPLSDEELEAAVKASKKP